MINVPILSITPILEKKKVKDVRLWLDTFSFRDQTCH